MDVLMRMNTYWGMLCQLYIQCEKICLLVAGYILGRALKNLDGLLRMPYGCGEQNMALLAPNIYILEYLKGTQQLTPAIMEKASNFLTSGESLFILWYRVQERISITILLPSFDVD